MLAYFTYGKHIDIKGEHIDETTTRRKYKNKSKKFKEKIKHINHLMKDNKIETRRDSRRSSRRLSQHDIKLATSSSRRHSSIADNDDHKIHTKNDLLAPDSKSGNI